MTEEINKKIINLFDKHSKSLPTGEKIKYYAGFNYVKMDKDTNIITANVKSKNNVGIVKIGLALDNIETLKRVINCLQSMQDVYSVKRIQTSASTATPNKKNNNSNKSRRKKRK